MLKRRLLLGASVAVLAAPRLARAWPDRPIRWVVPFTAGGPTDVFGRLLAERLGARLGQPVVVENRPGAGTVVANAAVARAAPDGYTLAQTISAFTLNPALRPNLPYDTLRDIAPVSQLAISPIVLVAKRDFPADDIAQMETLARARPDGLSYGTAGVGTLSHLAQVLLAQLAGIRMTHVPYNGFAQASVDLLQGRIDMVVDIWGGMRTHVQAGTLKVLGVAGLTPVPGAPGLPRFADVHPGFDIASSFGLIAPGGTPGELLARVATELKTILYGPEMAPRLLDFGMAPVGSNPDEYASWVATDVARWQRVVKDAGIRVEE
jgi:tripartite-type tricarboxylate transporter receptor subunit TctC